MTFAELETIWKHFDDQQVTIAIAGVHVVVLEDKETAGYLKIKLTVPATSGSVDIRPESCRIRRLQKVHTNVTNPSSI